MKRINITSDGTWKSPLEDFYGLVLRFLGVPCHAGAGDQVKGLGLKIETHLRLFFRLLSGSCLQTSAQQNTKYRGLTLFPFSIRKPPLTLFAGKAISTSSGEMT
jgi:hypothetical protein